MKALTIPILLAAGVCACAHNPRPESPEQRAQKDALFLQEQQNQAATGEPRGTAFRNSDDRYSPDYNTAETEADSQPEDQVDAAPAERRGVIRTTRGQMRSARGTLRSLEPVTSSRGGLLR